MSYSRDDLEWEELVRAGHEILTSHAARKTGLTYTDFAIELEDVTRLRRFTFPEDRSAIGDLLADISERGREDHPGLLLSALVYASVTKKPGGGFFALARHHGLLSEGAGEEEQYALMNSQVDGLRDRYSPLRRRS